MQYRFIFTRWFDRNAKQLGKRNPRLRSDLATFLTEFDPGAHPVIPQTGGVRKARMRVSGRGKSGGYRVIYYYRLPNTVWLLTIYDKVRQENLSPAEVQRIRDMLRRIDENSAD